MLDELKEVCKTAAHSAVIACYSTANALNEKQAVDTFLNAYFYAIKNVYRMTRQEIEELCKAAAHSTVIACYSKSFALNEKQAVNTFFAAYTYARRKLYQMNPQFPQQTTPNKNL